jgi:superfamily I DNA and RNA helicase
MIEVVYGQTKKKLIADKLVAAIEQLNLNGTLYIGYPVIASADEPVTVDSLLVCHEHGLVAFPFESSLPAPDDHNGWKNLKDGQDRIYFALRSHLARYEKLRKGRELALQINILTVAPVISEIPEGVDVLVTDVSNLGQDIRPLPPIPREYEIPLNAALQRISTLRPAKRRASVTAAESRGGILKRLEQEIANLDQWQKAAAIGSPEGPQRIRGIAGSGKTVVLALKAAYLHAQNPDWTIAVTFYSRSLYQQFTDLIRRFTFEQSADEPDWSKLRVLHAWGARDMPGMYLEIASKARSTPRDFLYAKSRYGRDKGFSGICQELLTSLSEQLAEPMYDAVLIDEAQDLPDAFFQLVHKVTSEPKRIVWAYDELQNLSEISTPPPEILFGSDANGNPKVHLANVNGQARQDITLPVCYRNTPWALTLAHALGLGIYRKNGLIQHFDDPELWLDIGYSVFSGRLAPGEKVVLERRPDSFPSYFTDLLDSEDAVVRMKFDTDLAQAEWVAHSVQQNLQRDEIEADDILIILPNALTAKSAAATIAEALSRRGIESHLAGVTRSQDAIFYKRSVALANIFRSKGNEAPVVYVINSHECVAGYEQIKLRNILFTAITRCRAWIRLCGIGPAMDLLVEEVDKVRNHQFRLEFNIPTEPELQKLRTIHRELTAAERAKVEKAERGLNEFLEAVRRGDLALESLPLELRTKLATLMNSLAAEEQDDDA